ncbi:coiled-coil domain-containing protein 180 [Biomphalaria glabrata]
MSCLHYSADKEPCLYTISADKEPCLYTSSADKEPCLVYTSSADKEPCLVYTSSADKEPCLYTSNADKEPCLVYTTSADKEPCLYTSSAEKEPCLYTSSAEKEPCLYTSSADKEPCFYTSSADKEPCLENAVKNGQVFVEGLVELSTRLLKQCDHILLLDEVDKGRVEPKLLPTSELIRRKKAGKSLEEEETNYKSSCSIASWIGLPMNQFCLEGLPSRLELSPSITTNKTTSAHSAVIKSRDVAYQTYKTSFDKMVQEIESTKNSLLLTETLWSQSWNSSVEKVKGLYQTES